MENVLQSFQLKDEAAENVAECIKKITPTIVKLVNCVNGEGVPFTRDISAMAARGFTECSVENFRMGAVKFFNVCKFQPRCHEME